MSDPIDNDTEQSSAPWTARDVTLLLLGIVAIVATSAAIVYAQDIFLILFLAILFGVFLTKTSAAVARYLPISRGWALGGVTTLLLLLSIGGVVIFGVQIDHQIGRATKHFDKVQQQLQERVNQSPTLQWAIRSIPFANKLIPGEEGSKQPESSDKDTEQDGPSGDQESGKQGGSGSSQSIVKSAATPVMNVVGSVLKTTFGLVINSMLIFFVGLFLAISPDGYRDGVVQLVPPDRRDRIREVMNDLGDTLWSWMLGRFGSMLVTGVGAGLLLFFLGVPLALSIGIVTALLTFIPNIGGFLALMLAMLSAMPQGGTTVAIVIGGYLGLQLIESYLVTPLIQQRQVELPPALLIGFQALFGMLFGFLGAMVASPILAAGKVVVEELYIKDRLEKGDDDASNNGEYESD